MLKLGLKVKTEHYEGVRNSANDYCVFFDSMKFYLKQKQQNFTQTRIRCFNRRNAYITCLLCVFN